MTDIDPSFLTSAGLKQQAKRLREALSAEGQTIGHGQALELIARQHGFRDWNTLSAKLGPAPGDHAHGPSPNLSRFQVGMTVTGHYLGQAFTGRVLSLTRMADSHYRITLHFDQPVDVVTFESFSALRQRVSGIVNAQGISPRQTSNGKPQLVIDA